MDPVAGSAYSARRPLGGGNLSTNQTCIQRQRITEVGSRRSSIVFTMEYDLIVTVRDQRRRLLISEAFLSKTPGPPQKKKVFV